MQAFRVLLVVLFAVMAWYTGAVMLEHGGALVEVFFGQIAAWGWPGQFNLDFACLLLATGLWIAWRHEFSGLGFALAAATVGGMLFVAAYLLVLTFTSKGDMAVVLLGDRRVAALRER